jgi:hypothetical protein
MGDGDVRIVALRSTSAKVSNTLFKNEPKGWGNESSGRALAYPAQGPDFNLQYCK